MANILVMMNLGKQPSDYLFELASRLKQIRKHQSMSQSEIADRSGVSLGSVKRFEQTGQISLESLLKLMHVLGRLSEVDQLLLLNDNLKAVEKLFSNKIKSK